MLVVVQQKNVFCWRDYTLLLIYTANAAKQHLAGNMNTHLSLVRNIKRASISLNWHTWSKKTDGTNDDRTNRRQEDKQRYQTNKQQEVLCVCVMRGWPHPPPTGENRTLLYVTRERCKTKWSWYYCCNLMRVWVVSCLNVLLLLTQLFLFVSESHSVFFFYHSVVSFFLFLFSFLFSWCVCSSFGVFLFVSFLCLLLFCRVWSFVNKTWQWQQQEKKNTRKRNLMNLKRNTLKPQCQLHTNQSPRRTNRLLTGKFFRKNFTGNAVDAFHLTKRK